MSQKITELFAYICTEEDGGEGVPAIQLGNMAAPLIGADTKRMHSYRQAAQDVANMTKRPVRLAVFRAMEVLETIEPKPSASAHDEVMNCNTCQHRRTIPGNTHSLCLNVSAHVCGDPHGSAMGWFVWPICFDPAWLVSCDGWAPLAKAPTT